jgi:hypothetical protein
MSCHSLREKRERRNVTGTTLRNHQIAQPSYQRAAWARRSRAARQRLRDYRRVSFIHAGQTVKGRDVIQKPRHSKHSEETPLSESLLATQKQSW